MTGRMMAEERGHLMPTMLDFVPTTSGPAVEASQSDGAREIPKDVDAIQLCSVP